MNLTASNETSSCGIAATEKVIKFLKLADAKYAQDHSNSKSSIIDESITDESLLS